jgi:hypothetical protein
MSQGAAILTLMVQNGQPAITDDGARVKAQNGAGYAPPGRSGDPRFGSFGSSPITNPFATRDNDADADDDCYRDLGDMD